MRLTALILLAASAAPAQVFTLTREQMLEYTASNPYERFADGRPKVPGALLEKAKGLSIEEVWSVLRDTPFKQQFSGNSSYWQIMHPEKKLVGRAVTVQFLPMRPDISGPMAAAANKINAVSLISGNVSQRAG